MAADSAEWTGEIACALDVAKVVRLPDGSLMAGCGNTADLDLLKAWIVAGADTKVFPRKLKEPNSTAVLYASREAVRIYHGDSGVTDCTKQEWCALGAHQAFVTGLLVAGKSAVECVDIAIERASWAGGRTMSMRLELND